MKNHRYIGGGYNEHIALSGGDSLQNEEFIMRHPWTVDFYPEDHDQRRDANNIAKLFAINRVPPKSESKFK